ncbi:DUF2637 domain-containing protein [Pseudonocardia alni]|uniref:DUF2637 domain-containing protein n=1 Tax=Pseudonocardia alni TaxID=33907 RepID=UPI00279C3CAA|nr:DUF2637 domain-containing protein [Pseudonocardia alni]WFG47450.1 DUF2637 domain-containing protein [Pseudonocardia alni]
MKLEHALYGLLVIVAAAAAVLSFTTLTALAGAVGFLPAGEPFWQQPGTAWLLPVTIDVGAAAGSLVWLSRTGRARAFGRALALALLGLSVAGNAVGHALAVADRPHPLVMGLLVVIVSAIPPAVLGAVVHLAMLCGRQDDEDEDQDDEQGARPELTPDRERTLIAEIAQTVRDGGTAPSSNELLAAWAIGRGRARRILREATDTKPRAVA